MKTFQYLVIGGGSGGMASARRAAEYKAAESEATVGLIESGRLGGACAHLGCVPNKYLYDAAVRAEYIQSGGNYVSPDFTFNWREFKTARDDYINQRDASCQADLEKLGVVIIRGHAKFKEGGSVEVTKRDGSTETFKGERTLIAVGSKPRRPSDVPGQEYGADSGQFFDFAELPKKTVVVGAGCTAVELASVFAQLGSETHLLIRHKTVLRDLDNMLASGLTKALSKGPVHLRKDTQVTKIEPSGPKLIIHLADGHKLEDVDKLIWAIGRVPNTQHLDHAQAGPEGGINASLDGYIFVEKHQMTSVPDIYGVGSACTPLIEQKIGSQMDHVPDSKENARRFRLSAAAAGRLLADRLFSNRRIDAFKYANVPSIVYSRPPLGSTGLSEGEALKDPKPGPVKTYDATFTNKLAQPNDATFTNKFAQPNDATFTNKFAQPTFMKIVCKGKQEKVVGVHILGADADAMLPGFAICVNAGVTKEEFDDCMAIPTTTAGGGADV